MNPLTLCITGSTDGIGLAAAKRFASAGHGVIVHGRDASRIRNACSDILQATGVEPIGAVEADFTDLDAVHAMGRELCERYSSIDLLINNAAVYMPERTLAEEGYETTFTVNYLAHVLLTNMVKPLLIANGGSVLNVSSVDHHSAVFDPSNMQGEQSYSGYDAYARSKLYNIMFTLDTAFGDKPLRSNSLDPGVISTKLLHAGWSLGGDDVSTGGEELYAMVMEIERSGYNGEYFENLHPARCSAVARDPFQRKELAELTGNMLQRFRL
ncbi:MAG: SDR family NAD(P)-dependent oxidoreductase [Chlorobiaceae bacterium]|nr:SDR family NAD(P)-dependent oxidoreductase [Chlorobiaceae bacterium]